jgi:hypothetical protein
MPKVDVVSHAGTFRRTAGKKKKNRKKARNGNGKKIEFCN